MTVAVLQWLIAAVAMAAAVVFMIAYRYAVEQTGAEADEADDELPRAEIVSREAVEQAMAPGFRGPRLRAQGAPVVVRKLQAFFIAFGITAIFFMCVCAVGVVALFVLGA